MLVSEAGLLQRAQGRYAVPAFNINNLEMLKAVTAVCHREKSPVIIQTTEKAISYAGIENLSALSWIAAKQIKMALHLDHGKQLSSVKLCIAHGYNSVMIDGSHLPFERNIALTKKAVALARRASVEAELGRIRGKEDLVESSEFYTDPEQAKEFVKRTFVDSLAVAIGTKHGLNKKEIKHGMKKGKLKLRLDILKEIGEKVRVPLVLHGGSDVPLATIKKCIKLGIAKINIDTELRVAFTKAVADFTRKNPDVYDPREVMIPAMKSMEKAVEKKIKEFGSHGKA